MRIQIPEHRPKCVCGSLDGGGIVEEKGGQDTVRCADCSRFLYNAPRTETGRAARTIATIPDVSPSVRAFVIERAGARCEACGWPAALRPLEIGHFLSKKDGIEQGLTDAEINHPDNLLAQCKECNSGWSSRTLPPKLMVAILRARIARLQKKGGA
jgi:hypothetical protein